MGEKKYHSNKKRLPINEVQTKMKSKNHMFVISTMGIGLALAMILDGMYGGKPSVPVTQPILAAAPEPQESLVKTKEEKSTQVQEEEQQQHQEAPEEEMAEEEEEEIRRANYIALYKQEKERKEREKQKPILEAINSNAYSGDGSRRSRRLYLLQQAYKASREATPIINVKPPESSTDSDDELASLIDLLDEEEEEEEQKEREDLMMLADTNRIRKRKQYRGSRKIVIEPSQEEEENS